MDVILYNSITNYTPDCVYSKWSNWSDCKQGKSCDENFQTRQRRNLSKFLNQDCPEMKERRKCYLKNCST